MANEFGHKDAGTKLTRTEDNAVDRHEADGETANDMLYFNGTSWIRATPATIRTLLSIIAKTLFDANTILKADSDNTPIALAIAEQRIVGRITDGSITALTAAQIRTLLGIEAGSTADQTGAEIVTLLEALAASSRLSHTKLDDVGASDHHAKYLNSEAVTAAKTVKLDELTAPTDVATLNSSTSAHGLLKKLDNTATNFMNGQGNWGVPAGGALTQEFTVRPSLYYSGATPAFDGDHTGLTMNAAAEYVCFEFSVPADFTSLTTCVIVINPNTTATHRFHYLTDFCANGEAKNTHSDSVVDDDVALTTDEFAELDASLALTNLAAGDHVGLRVLTDATNTANVLITELRFKYS